MSSEDFSQHLTEAFASLLCQPPSPAAFYLLLSLAEPHHINLNVWRHVILAYHSKINLGEINEISKTSQEEFTTVPCQFQAESGRISPNFSS